MSGDEYGRRFEVVAETRRRWSKDEKLAIVAEASGSCTNVSAVARRHGIKPALLYRWKTEQAVAGSPSKTAFVPVTIATPRIAASDLASASTDNASVEISLANGRRIRVRPDIETSALKRLIAAVED